MLTPAKRKAHGTLYVFESALGFVSKVFGLKQHEVVNLDDVSEVLRGRSTSRRRARSRCS